ncbi:MAG: hypothetical protein VYB73_06065 [Verrucomicrobiota bacterium]|nr:hypothetical protein [Verrucomicrobiota bacterium]
MALIYSKMSNDYRLMKLIDVRFLLSSVLIFIALENSPPVMAAPPEEIPRAIQDFLEGAVADFKSEGVRSYDNHRSGMICVEYGLNGFTSTFKFDSRYNLLESSTDRFNDLDGSFAENDNSIPLLLLPSEVEHALRALFPRLEGVDFLKLIIRGEYLYQINGITDSVRVFPVIDERGQLVQYNIDRDGDGLGDAYELVCGFDPNDADSDKDGFPDGLEHLKEGDPLDSKVLPKILKMYHDQDSNVMVITVSTCRGKSFFLEVNPTGRNEGWEKLGESVLGDGSDKEFTMPSDGFFINAMVRVGVEAPDPGLVMNADKPPKKKSNKNCSVPSSLKGREIVISQGKRLLFRSNRRGEMVEGGNRGNMVVPFSYTFSKPDHCKARLVLTFTTRQGFETMVYELTFVSKGGSGEFIAKKFGRGRKENASQGNFTISMNP